MFWQLFSGISKFYKNKSCPSFTEKYFILFLAQLIKFFSLSMDI